MKLLLSLLLLSSIVACQEVKPTKSEEVSAKTEKTEDCESSDEIAKKLEDKSKSSDAQEKAFDLSGGDTGCEIKGELTH